MKIMEPPEFVYQGRVSQRYVQIANARTLMNDMSLDEYTRKDIQATADMFRRKGCLPQALHLENELRRQSFE